MKTLTILILALFAAPLVRAQGGAVVRAAAEVGEIVLRRGGTEAAEELAKIGGKKAVQELMEQAAKEGGETLMKQTASLAEKHGVLALKAMQGAPGTVVRAVDGIPAELAEKGLRAIVSEPVVMQKMVKEFGSSALETAARHPGLAGKISSGMGREGLEMASKLTTEEASILARHAGTIAKLPAAERASVVGLMKQSPAKVLRWMETHPKLLLAGSATAAVVLARKEIFGEGDTPGFLERVGGSLYETFKTPVNTVVAALTGIVLLWAGLKMRRVVRAARR
ncbi:MAG TPA: hypothetical protein VG796_24610 [Verrucomicrobiales bacterium]|nr:hypothetical protein [Verrucomicrobiales bacterium]